MTRPLDPCALATVCVPWDGSGSFREEVFRRHVRALRTGGYENLYVFGTAGEGYAVTDSRFRRVASVFMEETADIPGLRQLGIIGLSTEQVRERIDIGRELGFDEFQVSLPSWGTLNETELDRFFHKVLSDYPNSRFLHYNTARGGRVLTGEDYARLCADHPNLVATKSGGHTVASLLELTENAPDLCHFVTELDYAAASLLGIGCGLLVSVSSTNPRRSIEFFRAGRGGDAAALQQFTAELNAIRNRVIAAVARTGGHMDGAYDKMYARLLDPEFPLRLQSPYEGARETEFEKFAEWLAERFPPWDGRATGDNGQRP
jgi:dihydrodipicolinate synthase/N-acetylneuraminate lyase